MQSMLEPAQGIVPAWGNASWPRRRVHLSAGFGQGLIAVETYMPARGFQRHRQPLEACRQAAAAVAVNQAQARRL